MKAFALVALLAVAGYAHAQTFPNVGSAVRGMDDTSELAKRYATTELSKTFEDGQKVMTVFIPNDAGMDSLLSVLEENGFDESMLTGDQSVLTDALKYHIVPGVALKAVSLKNGAKLKTDSGESVTIIKKGDQVAVRGGSDSNVATVVKADIIAGKAIVHVINKVLLPEQYAELLADSLGDDTGSLLENFGTDTTSTEEEVDGSEEEKEVTDTAGTIKTTVDDDTAAVEGAVDTATDTAAAVKDGNGAAGVSMVAALLAVPALLAVVL